MAPANFSPTQSETALVNQIFTLFDTQKFGILTGDVAIKAFAGANLPPTTLGEIWNIADEENNGWLSRKGVSIAVRLMGWAQRGEKVSKELLGRPGPLPTIDGISIVTQQNTGLSLPKSPPPPASLPPLTVQDRSKFHSLFYKAGPQNGLISGEKARGVFLKSKLSTDQLLQIWNLADTQDRGALDIADFTIGMYFIQAVMSRQLSVIPLSLPPGLYQQATGHTQSKGSHVSNNSGSFSPVSSTFSQSKPSSVQPQYTGQNVVQPNYTGISPPKAPSGIPSRPHASSPFTASPFGQPAAQNIRWDVTPSEKIVADRYFDDMDGNKRGYVDGDAAVPFMLKSGLGSDDLARIWDLADLDNNGQLTRDGFAVAMHLIQKRIAGQELPEVLPPSLVPPSMRNGNIHTATQQRSSEPVTDLFSFDDTPAVPPQPTGSMATLQPQQTGPKLTGFAPPRAATIDPFSQHQDLLGDDDSDGKHSSPPLHDKSAEIGNMQNQLSSTNRSLETAKKDRQSVEQIVANQEAQLSALQTQLSSAKAAYETETKSLATLKERQMNQMAQIQKSREELIHSESNLSAVRVEKAELEGVFLRDKEEARELHRKMMEAGQEAEKLKQELERAKKEAKQQKGLLAIARKQLSTKESERAKVEKDVEEATNEVTSLVAEREIVEEELAKDIVVTPMITGPKRTLSPDSVTYAAQHPLPATPEILNAGMVGRSNNPFDKLTTSPAIIETNGAAQPTFPADMFSFDTAFDTDEDSDANAKVGDAPQPASSTNGVAESTESTAVTPKAQPVDLGVFSSHSDAFFSPGADSEQFVTPPSSATEKSRVASPDLSSISTQESRRTDDTKSHQSSETSAAHFPPIEDLDTPFVESPRPGAPPQENAEQKSHEQDTHTDLNTEPRELDIDESDSDSEDEVPLSELARNKPTTQDKDAVVPADKGVEPSAATFNDIFGVASRVATEPTPRTDEASQPPADSNNVAAHNAFDAFGASTSPFETSLTGASTNVPLAADNTGISAFDEALKLMPTRNGTGASNSVSDGQQFTSDATFDEFFEFPSPSTSVPPSAPLTFPPTPNVNGSIPPTRADDGFNLPPIAPDGVKSFSFEEAFSEFGSNPSADVGSLATQATTQSSSPAPAKLEPASSKPFPSTVPASPQSMSPPRVSTGYPETSLRSSSPAPQKTKPSNPPLGPLPKSPRPSTSSSKDEKPGNIPTRHSKLSKLRLPFGKKKRQQQQQQQQQQNQEAQQTLASQPQLLSAPREQAGLNRIVSPGGDEDVQPVKQLISLGFDRAKAIEALERNGYDFQKALDNLVGSQ